MKRFLRALLGEASRCRGSAEHPWSLTREEVQRGFDQVRSSIPVGDDELSRAKPVRANISTILQ